MQLIGLTNTELHTLKRDIEDSLVHLYEDTYVSLSYDSQGYYHKLFKDNPNDVLQHTLKGLKSSVEHEISQRRSYGILHNN